MTEKCMANCMAKPIHLHLRNKIFYYRVELPRVKKYPQSSNIEGIKLIKTPKYSVIFAQNFVLLVSN